MTSRNTPGEKVHWAPAGDNLKNFNVSIFFSPKYIYDVILDKFATLGFSGIKGIHQRSPWFSTMMRHKTESRFLRFYLLVQKPVWLSQKASENCLTTPRCNRRPRPSTHIKDVLEWYGTVEHSHIIQSCCFFHQAPCLKRAWNSWATLNLASKRSRGQQTNGDSSRTMAPCP